MLTPEEEVRQTLIAEMIGPLGYPRGLLSVEKQVRKERRADLVCYTPQMEPLLLVECKAVCITDQAIQQAFGYNETIQAPFICLVSQKEKKTFWKEVDRFGSVPFLPTYRELYAMAQRR